MNILDSLIDGPLEMDNIREANELIGMIVRYVRTGKEPSPRTSNQRAMLTAIRPVLDKSRARSLSGSIGGSKQSNKQPSKTVSKRQSKQANKAGSDIYSSSSSFSLLPLPDSSSREGCGEGDGGAAMVDGPSLDEVLTYSRANCLYGGDKVAQAFYDQFEGNGWMRANGIALDTREKWQARLRKWCADQQERDFSGRRGGVTDGTARARGAGGRPAWAGSPDEFDEIE